MWPKTTTRVVPVPRGTKVSPEIRWCLAESVWKFADARGLSVLSFREADPLPAKDAPKTASHVLGASREEFDWHVFEAVLTRA